MRKLLHTGRPPVDIGYVGRTLTRFWEKVERADECWTWIGPMTGIDVSGNRYGVFSVADNGRQISVRAHRFAYMLLHGSVPDGQVIRHKCDNTLCVNPDHLVPGTQGDNVRDAIRRNRALNGELNGRAKLTKADVLMIRQSNKTAPQLAKELGVNPSTVYNARVGKKWKSLALPDDDMERA